MSGLKVSDTDRRSVLDILRRVKEEQEGAASPPGSESEDDEQVPAAGGLSDDTLARLAASDAPKLEELSPEEQRAFLRAVDAGAVRCACLFLRVKCRGDN